MERSTTRPCWDSFLTYGAPGQKEHLKNVSFSPTLLYMNIFIMCHQHASTHTCVRVAQVPSTEPDAAHHTHNPRFSTILGTDDRLNIRCVPRKNLEQARLTFYSVCRNRSPRHGTRAMNRRTRHNLPAYSFQNTPNSPKNLQPWHPL